MALAFMLDTDTVSFALRGEGGVGDRILAHRASTLCISSVTLGELRFGAERKRSRKLHKLIDSFAGSVAAVPFDAKAASHFAEIAALLERRGTPIGGFDTMIAAHARSLGLTLVTRNADHFSRVGALTIESWFTSSSP